MHSGCSTFIGALSHSIHSSAARLVGGSTHGELGVKVEIGPEKMHFDVVWCATIQFQSEFSGSRS